jgi:hypothetical protein
MGTGGMTGMASALAAEPGTAALNGTLVDGSGQPLGGVELTIVEELPPDGGISAFPVTTAADGSFGAQIYAWGTAAAPASVTIKTAPDEELTVEKATCTQTWSVAALDSRQLALADAAPEPLTVTATTTLLGEVCDTTGAPGGGGKATPPPTDATFVAVGSGRDRLGPALTLGFILGLALAAGFLIPRPGSRRRG